MRIVLFMLYDHFEFAPVVSHSLDEYLRAIERMNFLDAPVLGELGVAEGLRRTLHSASTEVRNLDGERALVTLGAQLEAEDMLHDQSLPDYRELARVLEPWLEPSAWGRPRAENQASEEP